ncbi:MAG: hypothetical protein ACKOWJ_04590, partial [Micrococcales bacterium]
LKPLVWLTVFTAGAGLQLYYPFLAKDEPTTNFHAAQLTANEVWNIDHYTCQSMERMEGLLREDNPDPAAMVSLAKQESRIISTVLDPWNTYDKKQAGAKDWHENAAAVWQRVLTFVPLYEHRNDPWFLKTYPKWGGQENFETYMSVVLEERDPTRLSDWMITLKHCVYAPLEPAVSPMTVQRASDDAHYCAIYQLLQQQDFNAPAAVAAWAQQQKTNVDARGKLSLDWTQLEVSLSSYLGLAGDTELPFPDSASWQKANQTAPVAILRNRIDSLCS